jgi:hypothetical protein
MAQLFSRSANTLSRVVIVSVPLLAGATAWAMYVGYWSPINTDVGVAKMQPVPFSHAHHVGGLGIDCRYCHTGVEKSSFAGIPPTETCMTCHSQIWRDAPVLEPVRESWATGKPLRWTRVHQLPDYVYFNHSIHVNRGVACISCHGRVDKMPLMAKAENLTMRWCLDCHRSPTEHLRPAEQVFAMHDVNPPDPHSRTGAAQLSPEQITRLQDCSICHR